jgi:hypothetical protein
MTIVSREEASAVAEDYKEILDKEWHHDHEIIRDDHGTLRWKENPKVREIIDKGRLLIIWLLGNFLLGSKQRRCSTLQKG